MRYFLTKAKYDKLMENGEVKTVKESVIFKAETISDVEKEALVYFTTDQDAPSIEDVKGVKYAEYILSGDTDIFYETKLEFVTLDERSGAEKKKSFKYLVESDSVKQAIERMDNHMKGTLSDYEITNVSKTNILEIYEVEYPEQEKTACEG